MTEKPYLYEDSKGKTRINHIKLGVFILEKHTLIRFVSKVYGTEKFYLFIDYVGWEEVSEKDIRFFIVEELGEHHKRNIVSEALEYVITHMKLHMGEFFSNLKTRMIPLRSGIIDYSNPGMVIMHRFSEKYQHDYRLNVDIDDRAHDGNELIDFIDFVLGDGAQTFYEAAGLAFMRENPIPFVLILFGSGGDGKSTILRQLVKILGAKVTALPLERITKNTDGNRFIIGNFINKQANVFADDKTTVVNRIENLKGLSGNDYMDAELKGIQDTVRAKMSIKFFFSMNEKPQINEINDATKRRFYIVTTRKTEEEVHDYIVENFGDAYDDDYFDSDINGFFTFCINQASRLIFDKKRRLSMSDRVQRDIDKWFDDNDTVKEFLHDHTVECDDAHHSLKDFTDRYNNEFGARWSSQKMKRELEKKGIMIGEKRLKKPDGSRSKYMTTNAVLNRRLLTEYNVNVLDKEDVENKKTTSKRLFLT